MSRGGYRKGAGRRGEWRNSETQVIRVPKILVPQILEIARSLDRGFQVVLTSSEVVQIIQPIAETQVQGSHHDQMDLFLLEGLINDSVTQSESLNLDSVTKSNTPPSKADGKRWLSSKDAWLIAKDRGCDRNLEGFRKWSVRHPDMCSESFSLSKLPVLVKGCTTAPAFQDLRYNDDLDCQDF